MADEILKSMPQVSSPVPSAPLPPSQTMPAPTKHSTSTLILIIIGAAGFIIGAGSAGLSIYLWQQNLLQAEIVKVQQSNNQAITNLQSELDAARNELSTKTAELQTLLTEQSTASARPDIKITKISETAPATADAKMVQEFEISDSGSKIGTIAVESQHGASISLLKQTAADAFLAVNHKPEKSEPYGSINNSVYRYNYKDKTLTQIFGQDNRIGIAHDISNDGQWLIYTAPDFSMIQLLNIDNNTLLEFPKPAGFDQIGDIRLSPNQHKFAYAASSAAQNNQPVKSAIFVVNINDNITNKITERDNAHYHVVQWLGNEDDNLQYHYFNVD